MASPTISQKTALQHASMAEKGNLTSLGVLLRALIKNEVLQTGVPTANPQVVGQIWNNAGVLTVSAG